MKTRALARGFLIFDTGLNGLLGVLLTGAPAWVDGLIGAERLMPSGLYRIIGVGFLLFFVWQITVIRRNAFSPGELRVAGWMAILPFAGLTAALIFMDITLRPLWRGILWAGDVYMLCLGILYFMAARGMRGAVE